jgi:hypothetical protein
MTPSPSSQEEARELKACPFCGVDNPMSGSMKTKGAKGWWIECRDCPALMEADTEAEAIAAWNVRPTPDLGDDLVEKAALAMAQEIGWSTFSHFDPNDMRRVARAALEAAGLIALRAALDKKD